MSAHSKSWKAAVFIRGRVHYTHFKIGSSINERDFAFMSLCCMIDFLAYCDVARIYSVWGKCYEAC